MSDDLTDVVFMSLCVLAVLVVAVVIVMAGSAVMKGM